MRHSITIMLAVIYAIGSLISGSMVEPAAEKREESTETVAQIVEEIPPQPQSIGIFTATAYCPCTTCSGEWGRSTSTGAIATQGRTVAVDPKVIHYGTKLIINGHTYIAEDCGGAIKGNKIDIYFDSHSAADAFGVQRVEVFVEEEMK